MMAIWAWARCRVPQAASSNTAIKLQDACNLFVISSTTSPPAACERGCKYFPLRRMDATFPRLNCQVNRFSFANVVRLCYYFKNADFTPLPPFFSCGLLLFLACLFKAQRRDFSSPAGPRFQLTQGPSSS